MNSDPEEQERRVRFGRELRAALEDGPLKRQQELADHLGVNQTTVSAWMHGRKLGAMTRSRVDEIERHLGCAPGTLAASLFGPAPIQELAPQIEERLGALEQKTTTVEAKTDRVAALLEHLIEAVKGSDRRLDDPGTS